jgi:uncharacterized protein (TIGR03435 family)
MNRRLRVGHTVMTIGFFMMGFSQSQAAALRQAFDVVSVKPNKSGSNSTNVPRLAGGKFSATGISLNALISFAYGVRDFQIAGGSGWMDTDRFDIDAKPEKDPGNDPNAVPKMLQALLADRFKLAFHRESKELPVYALVVGKNGSKLQKSKNSEAPLGFLALGNRVAAPNAPLSILTQFLSQLLGRIVLDKTGLAGNFDFSMQWTPDASQKLGLGDPNAPAPVLDTNGPSIFTAIQEQLGLKLESDKGPVEVLVIDHVERPSEN